MGVFVTLNKVLKQMGVLYVDLFREIGKMIKENLKRVFRSIAIGVTAFALCVILAAAVLWAMGIYNKYIFSPSNWNEYKSDRITMVNSMESQYDFIGMNQSQVESLLGKASYSTLKQDCEYIDLKDMEYDHVLQYELNKDSRNIIDMIDKNYVIAFKEDKVVYADVLIAD